MSTATMSAMSATTCFTFDHIGKKILGSEFNFKMSGNPAKPQYEALMNAMERHPNYTLSPIISTKKVAQKKTYAGLTLKLMQDYIDMVDNELNKATLNQMIAEKNTYPTIKSWFLEEFKDFNVKKAEREIAKQTLERTKATVRKVVRANLEKAKPVIEMPSAQNF